MSINPLREGLRQARIPEPCTMVIFGATGDLTHRKLVPALYTLGHERLQPPGFSVVGFARREKTHDEFRREMKEAVDRFARRRPADPAVWEDFAAGLFYHVGEFGAPDAYARLRGVLDEIDARRGTRRNRVFYLATPPSSYSEIARNLGAAGLVHPVREGGPWSRIIVEKPFGRDLQSARALNRALAEVFDERQIYRIDHYLGKETVQNILVLRFANGIFEPLWNQKYIDHVQITVAESMGVEGRGGYYEEAGALRDMVQNHMLQLLSLTAMEPPVAFSADAVRDEKVKVLQALRRIEGAEVLRRTVRGQYGRGAVAGRPLPGYLEERGVAPDSRIETYVAVEAAIDSWRWAGVPFYLRTGKALPRRVTEIAIQFRRAPHLLFARTDVTRLDPNVLALQLQPEEGIGLTFGSKVPGPEVRIQSVKMDFRYGTAFGDESPEAYERLLLDCMLGDPTLFTRRDEVEAAWDFVTRILDGWREARAPAHAYEAGTWGPAEADALFAGSERAWRRP
jgi:glucose-6-phosphate 1-dehydrogenase